MGGVSAAQAGDQHDRPEYWGDERLEALG